MIPHPLHQQAATQRESGDSEAALKMYEQVLALYQSDHNWEGIAQIWLEKAIVFLHLFDQTESKDFLSSALLALREADMVIQEHDLSDDLVALWALGSGNALTRKKEWILARKHYLLALEKTSANILGQANIQAHEAFSAAKSGDISALDRLENSISALEQKLTEKSEIDEHTRRTWLSGALLKKAELLMESSSPAATETLARARDVIVSEPVLSIRLKQLERLEQLVQHVPLEQPKLNEQLKGQIKS